MSVIATHCTSQICNKPITYSSVTIGSRQPGQESDSLFPHKSDKPKLKKELLSITI